jgi:GNAT superfamily N-acetyltransferase
MTSPNLYAEFISERENAHYLEAADGSGFVTYRIEGAECFIKDFFVRAEQRRLRRGSSLLEELEREARKAGCKFLSATLWPNAKGTTDTLKAALWAGFEVQAANGGLVICKGLEPKDGVTHG